jgi:predicted RNA-binding protein
MDGGGPKTWILTGSLDNFNATRKHGFRVIGMKERRRGMAEQVAVGDRIVFYEAMREAASEHEQAVA